MTANAWSRSATGDVLDVRALTDKTWTFYWPGRVVVEPLTDDVEWHPNGDARPLPLGSILAAPAFAGHVRVHAREGAAFRVLFGEVDGIEPSFYGRVHYPFIVALPDGPVSIVGLAVDALERTAPVSVRVSMNIHRARELLSQNLTEEADLEALATAVGVDRCHLCRSFQKAVGLPPYRYRAHVRIARARLLLAGGHDCTAVAHALGFCDQSHLTRTFKEMTGTTPGAYARACGPGRVPGTVGYTAFRARSRASASAEDYIVASAARGPFPTTGMVM